MENRNSQSNPQTEKTVKELLLLILKLFLKLLWAIFKFTLRTIVKSIRICIAIVRLCVESFMTWLKDKNTQEKIASMKENMKIFLKKAIRFAIKASKAIGHYSVIAFRFLVKWTIIGAKEGWRYTVKGALLFAAGLVWTCKNLIQLIINMKPTLIRWGIGIKSFFKKAKRGWRLRSIKRKRKSEEFKRRGGYKRVLQDTINSLLSGIASFMEEEQGETAEGAITEDDLFEEEIEESEKQNKAQVYGKRLFTQIKDIVDTD